ncbi:MAG: hypothetical protein QNJ41_04565 [Xenococcaceae cyanobacterium MO_188.B32]|nr:hypothetical protein [Xenococcaceae cyanobacterium MO_188.B32]
MVELLESEENSTSSSIKPSSSLRSIGLSSGSGSPKKALNSLVPK